MRRRVEKSTNVRDIPEAEFDWNEIPSPLLNLNATLRSGQCFRWRQDTCHIWWGTVEKTAIALWQDPYNPNASLLWQTFPELNRGAFVRDYLRLNVDLEALYSDWIATEPRMTEVIEKYKGLRILRQPPEECFFAFLCASCNTVVKIERSVFRLSERYGEPIEVPRGVCFAFPTMEALAEAEEQALRADLWGYRAPRVIALAKELSGRPKGWLRGLREVEHSAARAELVQLYGIGSKLADCICLFCLDKDSATPVDTHIWQLTCRLFRPDLVGKSLTPRVYSEIEQEWQGRFGDYAGWAQQYLFLGELDHH